MVGVTRWDRARNDEIRRRARIDETLAEKADRRVLRWSAQLERMDEGSWPKKVKAATMEVHQGRRRPRFGWLDKVKRALAVREVGLQDAKQFTSERSVWRELVRA